MVHFKHDPALQLIVSIYNANSTDTKAITLTRGKFAIVDADMYDFAMQWKWNYDNGYAIRNECLPNGKRKRWWLHRLINKTPDGMATDHINHDTLDDRRVNLRSCTKQQNNRHVLPQKGTASKYKGVTWVKSQKIWRAAIKIDKKLIYLGQFKNEQEAATSYNMAALATFREFALLNMIP